MSLYGNLYRRGLWPLYERLRHRQAAKLLQQAESVQWLTPNQIQANQAAAAQRLLAHAYAQCPWYRDRWEKAGIDILQLQLPSGITRLPIMTKDDIRAHRETMRATRLEDYVYEHRTGGSTGIPLCFDVNRGSYEWRLAMSTRGYGWAGCRDGDRQFYVWGAPIGTPSLAKRLKTRFHNAFLRRQMFNSFNLHRSAMARCVDQINAFQPLTVIGYTNALYLLAQYIQEQTQPMHRPNAVITAAEGVNAVQRATIEQAFGTPVFASYGSREFMLIAMECEQRHGLHISADNLVVEVVRPNGMPAAEGEIGEILVTDLHNYGMPFIRYKIGDLGVLTHRCCPCGRGLPLLEKVEGRVLDAIRTSDGRIVPGEFFPHLMKEFSVVKQFQVIQKELQSLEIKLVLRDTNSTDQLDRLRREIQQAVGSVIQVQYSLVNEIPQSASGKFRVTISEIPVQI